MATTKGSCNAAAVLVNTVKTHVINERLFVDLKSTLSLMKQL